jgi:hypothetical protein
MPPAARLRPALPADQSAATANRRAVAVRDQAQRLPRRRWLLRTRRERSRGRRAAEKRDELATFMPNIGTSSRVIWHQ